MYKWQNILEAVCAFPAIVLEQIVEGSKKVIFQEQKLMLEGEYDPEEEQE